MLCQVKAKVVCCGKPSHNIFFDTTRFSITNLLGIIEAKPVVFSAMLSGSADRLRRAGKNAQ